MNQSIARAFKDEIDRLHADYAALIETFRFREREYEKEMTLLRECMNSMSARNEDLKHALNHRNSKNSCALDCSSGDYIKKLEGSVVALSEALKQSEQKSGVLKIDSSSQTGDDSGDQHLLLPNPSARRTPREFMPYIDNPSLTSRGQIITDKERSILINLVSPSCTTPSRKSSHKQRNQVEGVNLQEEFNSPSTSTHAFLQPLTISRHVSCATSLSRIEDNVNALTYLNENSEHQGSCPSQSTYKTEVGTTTIDRSRKNDDQASISTAQPCASHTQSSSSSIHVSGMPTHRTSSSDVGGSMSPKIINVIAASPTRISSPAFTVSQSNNKQGQSKVVKILGTPNVLSAHVMPSKIGLKNVALLSPPRTFNIKQVHSVAVCKPDPNLVKNLFSDLYD